MDRGSDRKPLVAAEVRHMGKLGTHKNWTGLHMILVAAEVRHMGKLGTHKNWTGLHMILVAAEVRHMGKLGTHKKALEEAGDQVLPFTKGPLVFETTGAMGEETQKWWKSIVEMEADQRTHTRSTPEQTGATARAHVVSKQVLIILVTFCFNVKHQDASRIHSSVDRTCQKVPGPKQPHVAFLKLILSSFILLA